MAYGLRLFLACLLLVGGACPSPQTWTVPLLAR